MCPEAKVGVWIHGQLSSALGPEADALAPGRWLLACVLNEHPEYAAYGSECEPPMRVSSERALEIRVPLFFRSFACRFVRLHVLMRNLSRLWHGTHALFLARRLLRLFRREEEPETTMRGVSTHGKN